MPLWLVSQSFLAGEWRLRDDTKWRVGCHIIPQSPSQPFRLESRNGKPFYLRSLLSEQPMCNNWHLAMKFVFNLQLIRQNTVWPLSGKLAAFSVPCSSLSVSGDDRRKIQTPLVACPLFPPFPPTKSLKRPASQAIYIKFLEVLNESLLVRRKSTITIKRNSKSIVFSTKKTLISM